MYTNARVTRWFLALQDFRFTVDHRPGREHANADALSRRDTCLGGFLGYPRPEQAVECVAPRSPNEPGSTYKPRLAVRVKASFGIYCIYLRQYITLTVSRASVGL